MSRKQSISSTPDLLSAESTPAQQSRRAVYTPNSASPQLSSHATISTPGRPSQSPGPPLRALRTPSDPSSSPAPLHASIDLDDPSLSYSSRQQSLPLPSSSAEPLPPPLTLSELDSAVPPASFAAAGSRHVKDEIEELLYLMRVKEKEIRMSRGSVEGEIATMKRTMKKLQRDTDDLVRAQAASTQLIANALS